MMQDGFLPSCFSVCCRSPTLSITILLAFLNWKIRRMPSPLFSLCSFVHQWENVHFDSFWLYYITLLKQENEKKKKVFMHNLSEEDFSPKLFPWKQLQRAFREDTQIWCAWMLEWEKVKLKPNALKHFRNLQKKTIHGFLSFLT